MTEGTKQVLKLLALGTALVLVPFGIVGGLDALIKSACFLSALCGVIVIVYALVAVDTRR